MQSIFLFFMLLNTPVNMSSVDPTTFNVDQFQIENGIIFLADHVVESELTKSDLSKLFDQKEEINVRIKGNRISILNGDN